MLVLLDRNNSSFQDYKDILCFLYIFFREQNLKYSRLIKLQNRLGLCDENFVFSLADPYAFKTDSCSLFKNSFIFFCYNSKNYEKNSDYKKKKWSVFFHYLILYFIKITLVYSTNFNFSSIIFSHSFFDFDPKISSPI